ncbi:HNHc domain containing protein [uncultured Caudovirales phage]|uniref:HNHc domain containing protein n=1 Tax=uncultured Caudovirales phage TaxID=2100421 RepID=A0A6J5KU73_9CAUD|nr:HNHc domain containing protein [uncultured Caudovirales phage]CAB5220542.1 HNHc domain containing protein [uncultured Caudovirales phage]
MQKSIDDLIRENLRYIPDTGELWWTKQNINNSRILDVPIGRFDNVNYLNLEVTVNGKRKVLKAHRVAWFLYYGVWPEYEVDHINCNGTDNRISNLREATSKDNTKNKRPYKGCLSLYKGVSPSGKKWSARITFGKTIYLGLYETEVEAAIAYNKAALEYFGNFAKINVI